MKKKIRFPLPALRSMTAVPAETVCALPVMSRNSVTGAAPARIRISPGKRNPAPDMRAHTATKAQSGRRQIIFVCFLPDLYFSFLCFGKVTVISVPLSTSLTRFSVPPRKVTPCFTMERPSPVPPISFEWLLSTL